MERNWKGKLCWSILQLKYGCLHILTVHNIKEKMEEAFVKFVLFVQDDNGKGNFIRKQRKRGGGGTPSLCFSTGTWVLPLLWNLGEKCICKEQFLETIKLRVEKYKKNLVLVISTGHLRGS